MAQQFFYTRPDEMFTSNGTVTLTAGAVDADYSASWLADTRPGRPVRCTSGTATFRITNTSAEVGLIAVCHHNLGPAQDVTVSNGLSATITANTPTPPNGIPLNPFVTVTPTNVTALDFAISSNPSTLVIGEIIAGKKRTLTLPQLKSDDRGLMDFTRKTDAEFHSIPPYDGKLASRAPWKGAFILTTAECDNVQAWFEAQRNGTLPSLIVPNTSVNDAWVCFLQAPQFNPIGPALWRVQLTFVEVPRKRWP